MSGAHRLELLLCALYFGADLIGRLRVRNQPFRERIECERAENLAGPVGAIDAKDTWIRGGNGAVDLSVARLLAYGRAGRGDAGPLIGGTLLSIGGRRRCRGNSHSGSARRQHRCDDFQADSHGGILSIRFPDVFGAVRITGRPGEGTSVAPSNQA
jgi:hypothetical protein